MRRTTLGPISSSQLNARQAAAADAASARMSLQSKPPGRRSIGPLGGAISRRVSTAARAPPPPRNSVSRQSVGSGGRRSSTYGARSSMSSRGGPRAQMKDPRQLSDKASVAEAIKTLLEFLLERGFDQPVSQRVLRAPSRKDVYNMYQFLLRLIDPGLELSQRFEPEVGEQLRSLRYPFPLSKSALSAVGTPHTWPHLLGSILWLVELLSYDDLVQQPGYSAEEEEENTDKAFFDYLGNAYQVFLAGDDDQYNQLEKEEAAKHEEHNRLIAEQTMEMERRQQELKQQILRAKETKASLPQLRQRKVDCEDDLKKFHGYVTGINKATATLKDKIDKRTATLDQLQSMLDERKATIAELEKRIDQQEIKAADVDQMTKERTRLSEQITLITERQRAAQNSIWAEERHIAEQMDNVESLVQQYTDTATQMRLMPVSAKHAYGFDYEMEIDAHSGGVQAASELTTHVKTAVRQALLKFKRNRADRERKALDDALVLQDQVQRCREKLSAETLSDKQAAALSQKIEKNFRRNRDAVDAAIKKKADETEEVEMEIQAIRDDKETAVQQAQALQQLEDDEKAYERMSSTYTNLIGKNRHQVANALMACATHKETVEYAIASLEEELARVWP